MKYRVKVGAFVTRFVSRTLIVNAENIDDAKDNAMAKYIRLEEKIRSSIECGDPRVDDRDIEEL